MKVVLIQMIIKNNLQEDIEAKVKDLNKKEKQVYSKLIQKVIQMMK